MVAYEQFKKLAPFPEPDTVRDAIAPTSEVVHRTRARNALRGESPAPMQPRTFGLGTRS